jgi:predicted Rossmann-fold nucleotide-binding protein
MGMLADAALKGGAIVHRVITQRLADRGHLHAGLTTHETLGDMKARKSRMLSLADACIALLGGIGTVEEFMEVRVPVDREHRFCLIVNAQSSRL